MSELAREKIYQVIYQIPRGKVASYGLIAELAGLPRAARLVGATLKGLPNKSKLPWHRVINASGRISLPMDGRGQLQQQRLEKEGVVFLKGRVDMNYYGWKP